MRLVLVRHGETHLNREGRIQGIDGGALTATGRAQAQALARALGRDLPFHLYTSPLTRAVETAAIISDSLGIPFANLEGLQEADAGELIGLTGQEMHRLYPEFMRRWVEDAASTRMPGGESMSEVRDRAWCAITGLLAAHPEGAVVAISHNFTIASIVSTVLEMPLRHFRRLKQGLGSITRLDLSYNGRGTLVSLNETWHLERVSAARNDPIRE